MSWLLTAYAVVAIAVGGYALRLARVKRALVSEIDAATRRR
ncbi:MAG TPA: hypothetical protein VEC56_00865 [Candidatus Krumholzibacteria bacterium]|nr:hypothetical protein [Candidatus Krumholzibacteria bacterium]